MTEKIIHAHFDGSAHCVECSGSCRLTGAARIATDLARWMCESATLHKTGLNMSEEATLRGGGVDPDKHMNRARATR